MSELAIEEALKMAKNLDAEIMILHVTPNMSRNLISPYSELPVQSFEAVLSEVEKKSKEIIHKVEQNHKDCGVKFNTKILSGDAAYVICNEAKEGCYDLIVMANRGLGEIKQFLMGSVSNRVVKHADCAVLIYK